MKQLIHYLGLSLVLACNSADTGNETTTTDTGRVIHRTDTVYLVRNTDITPANSYNDLFLDSVTIEQFIQQKNISGEDSQRLKSFYNYRNGQFAWFHTGGFSEQARGFWNLKDAFKIAVDDKVLQKRMDTLLNVDTLYISRFDTGIAKTELALTHTFLKFYGTSRHRLQFANLPPEKVIPVKKQPEFVLVDTVLQSQPDQSLPGSRSSQYILLKRQLAFYDSIATTGGWVPLNVRARQLKKNSSSPDVISLKKRLQLTGDYNGADTLKIFNDSLEVAIKNYQLRNGMAGTGKITDTLIRSLNTPIAERVRQLVINLQRAQWLPMQQDSSLIHVNIPDFMLTVFENGNKVFEMPVVVGKEGTNTMIFTGELNQVVFSPYWNIPASIVEREILPAIKADPDYLKKNRMEIRGKNDSLPIIRQLPGEDNALGEVKFLFPNRYDIYFHDTKAKDIFKTDRRAVSNGCIRLADAEQMANYLLRDIPGWNPQKVTGAMKSGKEQFVKLNKPVPVSITYLTAWVDQSGKLQFRDDVYGHDKKISQMMFDNSPGATGNQDTINLRKK